MTALKSELHSVSFDEYLVRNMSDEEESVRGLVVNLSRITTKLPGRLPNEFYHVS